MQTGKEANKDDHKEGLIMAHGERLPTDQFSLLLMEAKNIFGQHQNL